MNKVFYTGKISEGFYSELMIGDTLIAEEIEELEWPDETVIHLRYTTSEKPINPETVEEEALLSYYGALEAEHGCIPFSEWTGFIAWDDTLEVGGHNLASELLSHEGKYCYLELWQAL
jgi:hypothetical protein